MLFFIFEFNVKGRIWDYKSTHIQVKQNLIVNKGLIYSIVTLTFKKLKTTVQILIYLYIKKNFWHRPVYILWIHIFLYVSTSQYQKKISYIGWHHPLWDLSHKKKTEVWYFLYHKLTKHCAENILCGHTFSIFIIFFFFIKLGLVWQQTNKFINSLIFFYFPFWYFQWKLISNKSINESATYDMYIHITYQIHFTWKTT